MKLKQKNQPENNNNATQPKRSEVMFKKSLIKYKLNKPNKNKETFYEKFK